ncbi:MAG TPA: NifU family protein [Longimicrobiales bacterium]
MLTMTAPARERVRSISQFLERPALRIRMRDGASPLAPEWEFVLVEEADAEPDETVVDADGVRVILDARSATGLRGRMLDYGATGFAVRLPSFESANGGAEGELAARVRAVIEERINPGVATHGGEITLVGVKDGIAYIEMRGGCQGCAMSRLTLRQGVERMIREAVPEIAGIQDVTDHASGTNPFYQHA